MSTIEGLTWFIVIGFFECEESRRERSVGRLSGGTSEANGVGLARQARYLFALLLPCLLMWTRGQFVF